MRELYHRRSGPLLLVEQGLYSAPLLEVKRGPNGGQKSRSTTSA